MNAALAKILKTLLIDDQNWKDVSAGLIKEFEQIKIVKDGEKQQKVRKLFPISCDITSEECNAGRYTDLVPNSKKRSISYFEDGGSRLVSRDVKGMNMQSTLRLVVWLNMARFDYSSDCSISVRLVASILNKIPVNEFNDSNFNRIKITSVSELPKTAQIFGRYTYDETIRQYLLYPFDYFALNIETQFTIDPYCFEDIELLDENECSVL